MGFQPLAAYGVIGNDDRCALIGRDGSIDWCCFPKLSSPSVFARILDDEDGGHFLVQPTDNYEVNCTYLDGTNVQETTFETRSGRATLTDFMPRTADGNEPTQRAIYRELRCQEGRLTFGIDYKPRFDYARADTTVKKRDDGIVATGNGESLHLQIDGPLEVRAKADRAVGSTVLRSGDTVRMILQYGNDERVRSPTFDRVYEGTLEYWRSWVADFEDAAARIAGDTGWESELIRSALVLKLLINEGTGAIYAAATASLPEEYGGSRNWDYRYNWIRDAKFTVQALYSLGRVEEAQKYFEWFQAIGHEEPADMQPVYGVHGETDLTETLLDHFSGHRHSEPVRIGNGAAAQRQLDIYGTIVQGMYETLQHEETLDDEDWRSIEKIVEHVCEVWNERDNGIWEYREEPRHYLNSKLQCWVAIDRGIRLALEYDRDAPIERWQVERSALRTAIEERGYSESAGAFLQYFGAETALDATCLLIPIYDFLPADDPRVESTIETVLERLTTDDGFVYRTRGSDVAPDEPTSFLFCTFWLIDALVLAGRVEKAEEIFETVLEHTTPRGLLAERVDPRTGELLGNMPQAFSHIGLLNSAIYLASARSDQDTVALDPEEDEVGFRPLFRS